MSTSGVHESASGNETRTCSNCDADVPAEDDLGVDDGYIENVQRTGFGTVRHHYCSPECFVAAFSDITEDDV